MQHPSNPTTSAAPVAAQKGIGAGHNPAPISKVPNRDRNPQSRSPLSVPDTVKPLQRGPLVPHHVALTSVPTPEGPPVFATVDDFRDIRTYHYNRADLDHNDPLGIIADLWSAHARGLRIITWYGLASAFHALNRYLPDPNDRILIREIAVGHIDAAFDLLCQTGRRPPCQTTLLRRLGIDPAGPNETPTGRAIRRAADLLTAYQALLERAHFSWHDTTGDPAHWWPVITYDGPQPRLLTVREALDIPAPQSPSPFRPASRAEHLRWMEA